jgi:glutamate-ammonia-ligase adenylyltransferase
MNEPIQHTDRALAERILGTFHTADASAATKAADLLAARPRLGRIARRHPAVEGLLTALAAGAPFLWVLAEADPDRLLRLLERDPAASHGELLARLRSDIDEADEATAMTLLRRARAENALLVALADLSGAWQCSEVTAALSAFAETAISCAMRVLLRSAAAAGRLTLADPENPERGCGLTLIGMGKLGAGELNYSSDVDLIAFHDPDIAPLAEGVEPIRFWTRLVQGLVKLLNERTADGYVVRVDLRLRPDPGSTPVAVSRAAAMQYYESVGQNWERAAMIKARPVAGDKELGAAMLAELVPFVWRKHLDYAAIADIHAMKRQIHAHRGFGEIAIAGHNIKLGRGGIREIEFFVQTQQLVAGGRNPALRVRGTLEALAVLARDGWITREARNELTEAYCFLRDIEHRLQMREDEQTHELPEDAGALARFARFAGFRGSGSFSRALRKRLVVVQGHYAHLFEDAPPLATTQGSLVFTGDADDPETLATLGRMGFAEPAKVSAIVRGWHHGRYAAMRSARARELLTELMPALLDTLGRTGAPDEAVLGFDRMLARVSAGVAFLSVLRANTDLLALLADVLGTAPRLAEIVARRPRVLDAVLDPAFFAALPDEAEIGARIDRSLAEARSYEDLLDRVRIVGQEQHTLIGVRILSGTLTAEQAGAAYARLAGVAVDRLMGAVEAETRRQHGPVPGGSAAVVAFGRLGAEEMTASSDLDLILLYEHPGDVIASEGPRPIAASQYFARLTQRLVAALSAPTGEGVLYPVDLRLRPSGRSGPVATSLAAFAEYQAREAWTWEHMALTRARPIAGPPELQRRIAKTIRAVLRTKRDAAAVATEVRKMRKLLAEEKGEGDRWDLKLARGGLVDIDFVAQFLVLAHAHEHASLLATGTVRVLDRARTLGLLSAADHEVLRPSARLQQDLTQVLRLCLTGPFVPAEASPGLKALLARAAAEPDFATLDARLKGAQEATRTVFARMLRGG